MTALLAACGGFLLAVLWMDLIFDVQVLGKPRENGALPEPVLASIAGYYQRATTDSYPMGRFVAVVMGVGLLGSLVALFAGSGAWLLRLLALTLLAGPVGLAALRVVPNAVRLGARRDDLPTQTRLARAICRDHLVCLVGIAGFVSVELTLAFAAA
ncbi:MAG TPA: hypothetical protein VMR31_15085 [Myxococcota bacterium]|nr:hypothetical protein [Myxococcota bacterium]